jgi:hypothetical protein
MKKIILIVVFILGIGIIVFLFNRNTNIENENTTDIHNIGNNEYPDINLLKDSQSVDPIFHLEKSIGNLVKIKFDPYQDTIIIIMKENNLPEDNPGVTEINGDDSYPYYVLLATTYFVDYAGYDGRVSSNETLITLDNAKKTGIPTFSLPGYKNDVMGILIGFSGGSGGSSQKLHLIDIETGDETIISSSDQNEPIWFTQKGVLGYIKTNISYVGPHVAMWNTGMRVIWNTYILDTTNLNFISDKQLFLNLCQYELNKIALSHKELKKIKGKSFEEIMSSEKYLKILRKIIGEVYYRQKLDQVDYIKDNIIPYLDESVIDEFLFLKHLS